MNVIVDVTGTTEYLLLVCLVGMGGASSVLTKDSGIVF